MMPGPVTSPPVEIDGSYGEGGGQILRTSLALSALTGRPVEITRIRAGRPKPGLQPQHLTAVRAVAALCAASVEGDAVGSQRLLFTPHAPPRAGRYRFEIGTAGAACLVAQTVLLPLAFSGGSTTVAVTGGTHVPHAPPVEYLEAVYLPALEEAGLSARLSYSKAGFYPRGGGELLLEIDPTPLPGASAATPPLQPGSGVYHKAPEGAAGARPPAWPPLRPLDLTGRGKLRALTAYIVTAGLPEHVATRGAAAVERFLKGMGRAARIETREKPSPGPGAAVVLAAHCEGREATPPGALAAEEVTPPGRGPVTDAARRTSTPWRASDGSARLERWRSPAVQRRPRLGYAGFTALGQRGRPMEKVAEEACSAFMAWWKSGAACDEHLADQLVLPMALAAGESRWTTPAVTEHLRTVLWVARRFLPIEVRVEERPEGGSLVIVIGAGDQLTSIRATA